VFGTGRRYDSVTTRVYYSNRADTSALNGPPVIYNTQLTVSEGQLAVDVTVGGPMIAVTGGKRPDIEEVLATFTADKPASGRVPSLYGTWSSVALTAGPFTTNGIGFIKHFTGVIPTAYTDPSLVRVMVQAVGGNGLVSIASNNGRAFQFVPETATIGTPKVATRLRLQPESGTYTATYKGSLAVSAKLTNLVTGAALGDRPVTFAFGRSRIRATTDHATGIATASLPVEQTPDGSPRPQVSVGFEQDQRFLASGDSRDVTITRTATSFLATSGTVRYGAALDVATLVAQLPDGNQPLPSVGVRLTLNDGRVLDSLTDGFGRVLFDTLDFEGVQPGSYPTTLDFLGNDRYSATHTTLTQTVTPGVNHSVSFNGVNGYVEVPPAPDLNITGNWTVETWFKDDDPNGFNHPLRELVMKGEEANPEAPYFILIGGNSVVAGVRTGGQNFPITWDLPFAGLDPHLWHHVAVTFRADLNVLNLWLDGRHITYFTVPAHSTVGNNLPLQIGRNGPITGKYWLGKIDDVRIWNIARTGADITATFGNQLTGTPSGLVANWKFDEPLLSLLAFSSIPATAGNQTGVVSTTGAGFSTDVPHP
jgi:hypothetical protein